MPHKDLEVRRAYRESRREIEAERARERKQAERARNREPEPVINVDWMQRAACKGLDPDLFFPERGENSKVDAAKAVCAQCSVTAECLDYAVTVKHDGITGERAGVWGGKTYTERRQMSRDLLRSRRVGQDLT